MALIRILAKDGLTSLFYVKRIPIPKYALSN